MILQYNHLYSNIQGLQPKKQGEQDKWYEQTQQFFDFLPVTLQFIEHPLYFSLVSHFFFSNLFPFLIIIPIKSMNTQIASQNVHKFIFIYPNHFEIEFQPNQAANHSITTSIPASLVFDHLYKHQILSAPTDSYRLHSFSEYKRCAQQSENSASKALASTQSINIEDQDKIYFIMDTQNERSVRKCCRNLLQQKVDDQQFEQELQNIIKEDRQELQNSENKVETVEGAAQEREFINQRKQTNQEKDQNQSGIKESPSRLFRNSKISLLNKQKSPSLTIPLKVNKNNKLSLKKLRPTISQLNNYQNPEQQSQVQVQSMKYVNITFILKDKVIEQLQLKKMELVKSENFSNYEVFYDKQCTKKLKTKNVTALRDTVFYCQPLQILQSSSKQVIHRKRFLKSNKNEQEQIVDQQFEEELEQAQKQIQTMQVQKKNIRVHQLSTMKITKKSEVQQSEQEVKKIFNVRRIRNIMF